MSPAPISCPDRQSKPACAGASNHSTTPPPLVPEDHLHRRSMPMTPKITTTARDLCAFICATYLVLRRILVYIFTHGNEQQKDNGKNAERGVRRGLPEWVTRQASQRWQDSHCPAPEKGPAGRHGPKHSKAGGLDLIRPAGSYQKTGRLFTKMEERKRNRI